ncbi:N(6)-adenine-specific methyltransferase METTL4 [Discoglossus pictus]
MSIVCESPSGWLLDELSLINSWYQHGADSCACSSHDDDETPYKFRKDLFIMLKPHIMSHPTVPCDPEDRDMHSQSTTHHSKSIRKKRKRSNAFNQGELEAMDYHKKISCLILEGSRPLIQEGLKNGFLQPFCENEDKKTDILPGGYSNSCQLADLCDMAKDMPVGNDNTVQALDHAPPPRQEHNLISHIAENSSDCPKIIQFFREKYLIPSKSRFLLSDVTNLEPLLQYKRRYNVIVIDPPWENKSVKRSKRYNYLSPNEIKRIPVPALAAPGCLVVTWVTNRQKHLKFVKEELYPDWSVKTLAEWHWVKITRSGEFVFPLDSTHKKPYEILVLGQTQAADTSPSEPEMELPPIPEHKLIVSVPCSLHSHKPPLSEILKEYVKPDAEGLELFARNLQPGWTSWGNEVLKFQHMDYFTRIVNTS